MFAELENAIERENEQRRVGRWSERANEAPHAVMMERGKIWASSNLALRELSDAIK
jgi:hypothetical protein